MPGHSTHPLRANRPSRSPTHRPKPTKSKEPNCRSHRDSTRRFFHPRRDRPRKALSLPRKSLKEKSAQLKCQLAASLGPTFHECAASARPSRQFGIPRPPETGAGRVLSHKCRDHGVAGAIVSSDAESLLSTASISGCHYPTSRVVVFSVSARFKRSTATRLRRVDSIFASFRVDGSRVPGNSRRARIAETSDSRSWAWRA